MWINPTAYARAGRQEELAGVPETWALEAKGAHMRYSAKQESSDIASVVKSSATPPSSNIPCINSAILAVHGCRIGLIRRVLLAPTCESVSGLLVEA